MRQLFPRGDCCSRLIHQFKRDTCPPSASTIEISSEFENRPTVAMHHSLTPPGLHRVPVHSGDPSLLIHSSILHCSELVALCYRFLSEVMVGVPMPFNPTGTKITALALLACIFALLPTLCVAAKCSIYNPGLPTDNGIPRCPCGQAYVTINCVGAVPSACSTCSASWTSNGCYSTTNSIFTRSSGSPHNPRCECGTGACCRSGTGSGMFSPSGTVCRGAAGECDVAETCSGSSSACPGNAFKSSSTSCGAAPTSPGCDLQAKCTGKAAACPAKGFKTSGTVCQAASGGCQNSAVCTGKSYTCPTRIIKANGTVCLASSGFCQNDAVCDGATVTCPTRTFKSNSTVCNPTEETCFTSAVCTGTKAACDPITIKPMGTICGNNSLCTKPLNNSCDSTGECIFAECPACPNGFQGADCTCPAGPPTYGQSLSLNATCFNGTWYVQRDVNNTLNIQPGSSVLIEGSVTIPLDYSLKLGSGSLLNVTECLTIYGTIQGVYSAKFPSAAVVDFADICSLVSNATMPLITQQQSHDKCTSASSQSSVTNPGVLTVLFQATSTCSFNYPAYVIAPIVAVAGATGIAIASYMLYQRHALKAQNAKLAN